MTSGKMMLSVDGGATKTDMVLFYADGHVIGRIIGGPSNSSEIGFERSVRTIKDLSERLLAPHGGVDASLCSVYAGVAGGGIGENKAKYRRFLKSAFPNASFVSNGSDAINALNSGVRKGGGIVLVAGTGSVVYARENGVIHQVGGWGHLLGDEGSGYDIGRMGLRRALQALDGRAEATSMTEAFARKFGQRVDKAIPSIYEGGKRLISSFAPIVFDEAAAGDAAAMEILGESAGQLARLVLSGCRFLKKRPFPTVFSGGLFNGDDGMLEKMILDALDERFIHVRPKFPPVYGSAIEAVANAGLEITEDFDENFNCTLPKSVASE